MKLSWLTYSILSAFSGMLAILAFAPFNIFPAAIISLSLLFFILWQKTRRQAFGLGLLFGIGYFGAGIYWIFISIHHYGNVEWPIAFLITSVLIMFLSLFPALVCYLANCFYAESVSRYIFAFPALWVLGEWIRSWIFSGFPWLFLGYSQTLSPLKGFAPVLSVYGVSLFMLITAGCIFNAWLFYRMKRFPAVYLCLLAAALIWIGGATLNLIHWTLPKGAPIAVSIVQGNIPQSLKWSPEHLQLSLDRYTKFTQPLWRKDQLIIWPEAAIPLTLKQAAAFIELLDEKARQTKAGLILGIPLESVDGRAFFNAIITLGDKKQSYLKRFLVPFGEYIPSVLYMHEFFNFINIPISNLKSGRMIQAPFVFNQALISPSICFEIAFPELIRLINPNIGVLLTLTNDAWFGYSTAQAQHLQIGAMRAMENGRPLIFASNDGISAIINAEGQVLYEAPAHQAAVLEGKVQPVIGRTPWMFLSMNPILILLIMMLVTSTRLNRHGNENQHARTISATKH